MADLSSLIRLHKHELDEKRRALAALYQEMAEMEKKIRDLERAFEKERAAISASGEVHFTFAQYAEKVRQQKEALREAEAALEKDIEQAKDNMMETFSELKKYEMTQAERERIEEAERAFKESQELDAIGIEGHRRKEQE